ncbi:MAG TPA: phosphoribosylformylglycinamidine cyclo-ligase [Candidatus Xenobia bacterium]|nr:phosphoribosylformylglycinamidine cyclo-ligase [Candidatus Xenobia bacterium]
MPPTAIRYADAGVDRDRAESAKRRVAAQARSTFTRGVLSEIGRFAALFELDVRRWRRPVLLTSVDGVGTKLKVAAMAGRHAGVGEDLVHHCVNDIAVHGAAPLAFLDYIGASRLDPKVLEQVFRGMSRACRRLGIALIGGETAELPGLYAGREYDLVGFILGVADRNRILDGRRVRPGDLVLGLPSSGLHTNGYSLARKLLFEVGGYSVDSYVPELKSKLGAELLKIHRCYYPLMKPLLDNGWLTAAAHITGGGLSENIPRVLPRHCAVEIRLDSWSLPPLFRLLERLGNLPADEMLRTFNLGIGMVLMVSPRRLGQVERFLKQRRERFFVLGEVVRGRPSVRYEGSWQ